MTDQQMEDLVERIIQRLRPPVLVMVTAAAGYRHAIRQRLAGCGESLHLALDSGIGDGEQWRAIGKTLAAADWQQELPSASYKALLLPFLDYPLAADLVKGKLTYQGGMAGSGGSGAAAVITGNVQVNGNIDATGTIMDVGGNSNHHSH